MNTVRCNLCGSSNFRVFLSNFRNLETGKKFRLVKCMKCGLVFINPRPNKKELLKYYKDGYWSSETNADKEHEYLYKFVENLKLGKVLDIGAGTGLFLSGLKKRGWDTDGTEPSANARAFAKNKFGISLKKQDFLEIKYSKEQYDLVVLNNVLEHLPKPKETLKKVNKILKKNGHLLLAIPNIEGLGASLFGKYWYGVDVPRHLFQFSPKTIKRLLDESGFNVLKTSQNYYKHNSAILFESFRRKFSPKFAPTSDVAGVSSDIPKPNLKKSAGILASKAVSSILALTEPVLGRGEIIIVLARKLF